MAGTSWKKSVGSTGFYGRGKRALAPKDQSAKRGRPERWANSLNEIYTGIDQEQAQGRSLRLEDSSHTAARFSGYQQGMSLRDAAPTLMNTDSSDNSDVPDDADPNFSNDLDHEDHHQHLSSKALRMPRLGSQPHPLPMHQSGHHGSSDGNIIALLQSQQASLQKVLEGQKKLEQRQGQIEEKLLDLQAEVQAVKQTTPSSSSPESSSGGKKRKRIVTRTLSSKVYAVHEQMETKFNITEVVSSDCNKQVQSSILREILNQPDCKFPEENVKVAIKRCYENLRRTHLEHQPGKEEFSKQQGLNRKYHFRRERKFKRRTGVVTSVEMERYWQHLNLYYVTEKSDDEENPNGIVEHQLPWRAKKLSEFMAVFDERLARKESHPVGLVAKKVRKIGSPSTSLPPPYAPAWSVDPEYHQNENTPPEGQTM